MKWILVLSMFTMQPDGNWSTERASFGPFPSKEICLAQIKQTFDNGTQGIASCQPIPAKPRRY